MIPDLTPIFSQYERLRAEADAVFASMASRYPECVKCAPGCDDCCHALFDLPLVEAMYVNLAFNRVFGHGKERSDILEKASKIDRDLTRLKRELFRAEKDGEKPDAIIARAAALRMPCPLLTGAHECALYGHRPITCRLYGIPLAVGGESHACGFSAFDPGRQYPTARLDKIHDRLRAMSADIEKTVQSRFELTDIYVPLSMALLTRYDENYLGIGKAKAED